jgi:hypothetical protein
MKLVKEHIKEAIKHLKPRSFEEIEENYRKDVQKVFHYIHKWILYSNSSNDEVSPNLVANIAYNSGIHLSSDDVVYISDNYEKWEAENYPEVNEAIKHLKPKTPEELEGLDEIIIEEIDSLPFRDDKIKYLCQFLEKDWDKVYKDIIDWISDDEFDAFCYDVIKNPDDYKE